MYSEPSEASKMEPFAKLVDCFQLLTILAKLFVLGVSQGYEYASDKTKQNPSALTFISQNIRTAITANFFLIKYNQKLKMVSKQKVFCFIY